MADVQCQRVQITKVRERERLIMKIRKREIIWMMLNLRVQMTKS